MDIEEYLQTRVDDQLMYANNVAYRYRSMYTRIEWVLIIVASLTPIFVILNFSFSQDHWAQWIPVVSSAMVAMLTGGMKTFRYDEKWRTYRELAELLKKEKYQFMTGSGTYASVDDPETVFIETVETILRKA